MQPENVIAFNITLLAAMASPGPALVVAIRTVLSAGPGLAITTSNVMLKAIKCSGCM